MVLAKSFARIHWQNLVNFGVLPLTFADPSDLDSLQIGDVVEINGIAAALAAGQDVAATVNGKSLPLKHDLSRRQIALLLRGGVINWLRERISSENSNLSQSGIA